MFLPVSVMVGECPEDEDIHIDDKADHMLYEYVFSILRNWTENLHVIYSILPIPPHPH